MIASTFQIIAKKLDEYFKDQSRRTFHGTSHTIYPDPDNDKDPAIDIVGFLQQEDQQEFIKFPLNRVTPILINIEEEGHLRPAERFSRVSMDGNREPVFPDIRLNLYILFVAHFYDYTDALYYMGLIIKYFQSHPILDHNNTPDLHQDIDKLLIELNTLPISAQNEVWNALRSAYHPSLLYKVKMLVFQDQPKEKVPGVSGVHIDTGEIE